MSYFICGEKTAEYLQHLMYKADLEAYKKSKRKKKKQKDLFKQKNLLKVQKVL